MIFQDPMTSLNPVYRIGWQIAEQIRAHEQMSKQAAHARAIELLLTAVGIPHAAQRVDGYPHQFSGGMRQRVMIAMAVSCNPDILIADEPTTALDVTIQAQILNLIRKLKDDFGTAVVLITHDMGVVADLADRIAVMYAGRIVERGSRHGSRLLRRPASLYLGPARGPSPGWIAPSPDGFRRYRGCRPRCSGCPRAARSATAARTGSTGATSGPRCWPRSATVTWTRVTWTSRRRGNCGRPPSTQS